MIYVLCAVRFDAYRGKWRNLPVRKLSLLFLQADGNGSSAILFIASIHSSDLQTSIFSKTALHIFELQNS